MNAFSFGSAPHGGDSEMFINREEQSQITVGEKRNYKGAG
jgi:hypothetical protein